MRRAVIAAIAAYCLWIQDVARAVELSLFDVELRTATPTLLHKAALAAGARLINSSGGHKVYDATRIGLPGALALETLFDGEQFVVAAYSFNANSKLDHDLRRLLVAKYGQAYMQLSGGKRYPMDLEQRYADGGTYHWTTDAPIELIYTNLAINRTRFGHTETRLTYVNRFLFEEMQRRSTEDLKQAAREHAARLKGTF